MGNIRRLATLMGIACLIIWGCSLGSALSSTEEATVVSPAPEKFTLVRLRPSDGSIQDVLKAEAQKAQEARRTPYVEFDAEWCSSCQALSASLSDERMIDAFEGTYIIRMNLDEWRAVLPDAGFDVIGIPVFFEIDEGGKPTGHTITGAAWGADIPENMAPSLKEYFHGSSAD